MRTHTAACESAPHMCHPRLHMSFGSSPLILVRV